MSEEAMFVIVGGGIAGVTCAETLAFLQPNQSIILLSESALIKSVNNLQAITRTLSHFDIEEKNANSLTEKFPNITIILDRLTEIDDIFHQIKTASTKIIKYQHLCLCMGAEPKLIPQSNEFAEILGIRDTDSVDYFTQKLQDSKKIIIVGNGGIASELIYKIKNTEVHWVIKDKHISSTFIDPGAAEFFQSVLNHQIQTTQEEKPLFKRMRYSEDNSSKSGAALGPDWYKNLLITGSNNRELPKSIIIHYESEISSVKRLGESSEYSIEVVLTNSEKISCDLIVSATGVSPRRNYLTKSSLEVADDGGIKVDEFMRTSLPNVYAAGDICSANWEFSKHWVQMKLWTQARQMGCYAAKCMSGHLNNVELLQDFCFELFAHSTKLFGFKVILLGLYNGQKLDNNYEILLRMTKGKEYIKFVLENHKLQGAILIGDTDLEEMCENLILNQLDLEQYGDDILNPNIDIEDYFD